MDFTTLRAVVSFDVDDVATFEVRALATNGGALFLIILVSCLKFLICCMLSAHTVLFASFIFITNYSAANTVESSSEISGTLQCEGSIFAVREIWMAQVLSIQCHTHL